MDQKQRLDYLVEKFKEDSGEYRNLKVSDNDVEKKKNPSFSHEHSHAPAYG